MSMTLWISASFLDFKWFNLDGVCWNGNNLYREVLTELNAFLSGTNDPLWGNLESLDSEQFLFCRSQLAGKRKENKRSVDLASVCKATNVDVCTRALRLLVFACVNHIREMVYRITNSIELSTGRSNGRTETTPEYLWSTKMRLLMQCFHCLHKYGRLALAHWIPVHTQSVGYIQR